MTKIGKCMWIVGGSVCLSLGVLGIFLPFLPTTPFLLLAAFCFGHGSERIYHWLVNHSPFRGYIRNYRDGKGIPLEQKLMSITLLWLTIGTTLWFAVTTWWLKVLLILVAIGVTIHLSRIKTRARDSRNLVDRPYLN